MPLALSSAQLTTDNGPLTTHATMRWIIGDGHGMLAPLARLLEEVGRVDPAARYYFVGDYINRGPDSKGVIDLLLSLGSGPKFVRGNHDDIFDQVLNSTAYADNGSNGDR